jgi:hypothetical protein
LPNTAPADDLQRPAKAASNRCHIGCAARIVINCDEFEGGPAVRAGECPRHLQDARGALSGDDRSAPAGQSIPQFLSCRREVVHVGHAIADEQRHIGRTGICHRLAMRFRCDVTFPECDEHRNVDPGGVRLDVPR